MIQDIITRNNWESVHTGYHYTQEDRGTRQAKAASSKRAELKGDSTPVLPDVMFCRRFWVRL